MATGKRLMRGALAMLSARALRSSRRPSSGARGARTGGGGAAGVVSRLVRKQLSGGGRAGRRGRY
ncbi:hypothetical protein [Streptomyces sp. NBC_01803]|uniref:hypothetical protein n=1 Tax=Streptomyces sp. NBC_01803 TaxID=2975946 RepID=UPI002DDBBE61|nr:hypothetical protein [Streptomyces sp. NBC_01803]WSA45552.1 hypothetical protein OIE51_15900 [Streptomyces sp. NBC_01803]